MEELRSLRPLASVEAPGGAKTPALPPVSAARAVAADGGSFAARGIFGFNSMDVRSRSFNLIRSKLIRLQASKGWRTFGVVSATPHVGKSFIAANVAASLSRDPRVTTHLFDLDLRRASLSELLGLPWYVAAKIPVYVRLFTKRQIEWVRTKRDDRSS